MTWLKYFKFKSKFLDDVRRFTQTGIFDPLLLRCIWKQFEFSQEVFDTMIEMLTMLDLCYRDEQSSDSMLRLPWFIQETDMSFLNNMWPEKLPQGALQYTLTYCFCHRIPGVIYERFCVRLQRHLQRGGHTRQDRRHAVYIEQDGVQILFQRHPFKFEPIMQIHLRCSIDNLLQLQKFCLTLHKDMDNLCSEYSGLYIDCYLPCPHCLLTGSTAPTKRSTTIVDEKVSLQWVPCDPSTPGSTQIPAALIFLRLFGTLYTCLLDKTQRSKFVILFYFDENRDSSLLEYLNRLSAVRCYIHRSFSFILIMKFCFTADSKDADKHLASVRKFCYDETKDRLCVSDGRFKFEALFLSTE